MRDYEKITKFPVLQTKNLILKEIKYEYADDIFNIYNNPEVSSHYALDTFKSVEDAERLIDWYEQKLKERKAIRWGIAYKNSPVIVGTCGLYSISPDKAKIGYDLNSKYWGMGIMSEALPEIINYAFSDLGINRVEVYIMMENSGSFGFIKKLGFTLEGTLREYEYFKGKHHDMAIFSLLKKEH